MFKRPENRDDIPRVIIGGGEDDILPALVTAHSLRRNTPEVDIIQTFDLDRPMFLEHRNPTEFSLVRWWIPQLCGFQGRAIYLDSDMVVRDDIRKLFNFPMGERAVMRTPDPSVMLIDCGHELVKDWDVWDIRDQVDKGTMRYHEMWSTTNFMPLEGVGALPEEWNHRDHFEYGTTKNLHYTMLRTQPWRVPRVHPLEREWVEELVSALEVDRGAPYTSLHSTLNVSLNRRVLTSSPFWVNIKECIRRCRPEYLEKLNEEATKT